MKTNILQTVAIAFFISGIFFFSQNVNSQPAPDENFCAVKAKLLEGDSVCRVGGHSPLYYYFDDGEANDYALWVVAGGMSAVKFKPPGYPVRLTAGQIYVGDGSFPVGNDFLGTDFQVVVFDDDGPDGFPGTLLDSLIVTVENYEWIMFNDIDVVIDDGAFYLGMKQLYGVSEEQHAAPIGIDTDVPTVYKSYIKVAGGDWILSPYQDFMIRAYTCGADLKLLELNAKSYYGYEIARVSDFNPNDGEGPEDGVLTIIDSVTYFHAYDSLFYSLPPGYYAYAVRMIQDDTITTGWYYTNTVSHLINAVENINIDIANVRVFPNPAFDVFNVESSVIIQSVHIVNALGQTVFSKNLEAKEISIRSRFLKSGFYFISIKTRQGLVNKKILIGER
ncbi:MAG: hypothetical protein DRI89_04745 [Bacteroidetes bacterium]|nr:MAG: hypothetical protein DRI89_04745 [Bacteroidota bacterium]